MRRWIGPMLVAAAVSAWAGPAAALEPGVHVDPSSPASKEYSFPLGALRAQGAGHRNASAGIPQPLFGVGVTPANAARGQRTTRHANERGTRRHHNHSGGVIGAGPSSGNGSSTGGSGGSATTSGSPKISRAELIRLAKPGSAIPWVVLITVVLLAAGVAGGAGFRLLTRSS
jgi:hypothetical protein